MRRDKRKNYPVFLVVPWCKRENRKYAYQEFGREENLLDPDNPVT